ncbi:MAG: radical SAM protein [Methanophagales archaeon ANME-1-THS]|nr:MAG: radical SAM protein [Methanophagales archaeon ANME-1-THS]
MTKRGLLYFTLSEIEPRVWFMLTGCNFNCRGCFRPARDGGGTLLTAPETLERMERACLNYYGNVPAEALITGGEPTLDKEYLLSLVRGLKERGFEKIVLMTNGYELGVDEAYVPELEAAGLTESHVDLKAYSDELHQWYTGKSNRPVLSAIEKLNASRIELLVQTIYMPGLVDDEEIEKIAQFLASVNPTIRYRINPFASVFAYEKITRRPTLEEMERAYTIASKYLPNTIISRSCYREYPTPPPQKTWITVYPDLTIKRRGMKEQAEERLAWLSSVRPRESVERDWQNEEWDFTLRHSLVGISESPAQHSSKQKKAEPESGQIKVKFPQALHRVTKTRLTELEGDGLNTVEDVLKHLVERYGEQFSDTVLEIDGTNNHLEIKRSFNVYLNGMNIKNLRGIKTEVRGNDELIILSWVSGG